MQKLSHLLRNKSSAAIEQMKVIYKVWYSIVIDNLKEITTPYRFDPYTKTLTIKVHDNLWLSDLSYLKDDFKVKLNENGLTVSKIVFKYSPKYERIDEKKEDLYEISRKCQNYIESIVKKIDNKEIAEAFRKYLITYFQHNSFEDWIVK